MGYQLKDMYSHSQHIAHCRCDVKCNQCDSDSASNVFEGHCLFIDNANSDASKSSSLLPTVFDEAEAKQDQSDRCTLY